MNKAYFETLPKDYFGNLYQKVSSSLTKGENVCLSVIPGFGEKTIFNFLSFNFRSDKLFDEIYVYDPELENENIIDFTKKLIFANNLKNKLLIIRFFEQIEDKPKTLEKLDSLRRKNPKYLTYLAISNQEALLYPSSHQALTTVFFSDIIYFLPFDTIQTASMINSLINYYGWNINLSVFDEIYHLSGGIPRIIKYLTKELYESHIPLSNKDKLILIPQISFQLKLLTIILITHNKKQAYLLGLTDGNYRLKSSLLKYYIKNFRSEMITRLYPQLSDTETKILSFFSENEGKIVSLDNLAALMKMSDDNFSLWAIYKVISRLKPKIKNNFNLKNVKGRGYVLTKVSL
ncbi:hypothetical protein A3A76_05780 [Candidatus Woesebacteria bacterium RIFCSPLOWO2_01_FULL_39_23]|uniref:OmpR/PhoB-type domain-containing protein n=1 Tax=Candidatus Woesebacteria bacterium RIFCSPHIGHO2_01_FULL_40_22 TaxID=1802499 RepID=A0A1F7YI98_9BACT|nr:MAG: hypothetical protein A2141_02475 [Candidatus Woesebacteria bacterium RBG_16_40_11]OGM26910.1 MAG: hypothetical protein A2628_05720 [Candidatus Woesebacteria bacterium RIFCSPHIGHO2_01_FULL_40_22]OGM38461.1 MAG: hypothetical protein A3E41_01340 [Candidatus Woesebacteria bacterium RIFCSPHIGHO2_12_FULL_38_9]OGM63185.1 MAG: hypothetical protein A3A76_05780 [Candidatus Woesebacteria bacterium RIFCSPLOWO2_01_FULL_39_23]